jgi:hypothetical protein
MQSATAYSTQIEPVPVSTVTMSTTSSAARAISAATIARRRSTRSAMAPAGRANRSHGSERAKASPAINVGECVSRTATRGSATLTMPSARLDSPLAVQSCQKAAPRRAVAGAEG